MINSGYYIYTTLTHFWTNVANDDQLTLKFDNDHTTSMPKKLILERLYLNPVDNLEWAVVGFKDDYWDCRQYDAVIGSISTIDKCGNECNHFRIKNTDAHMMFNFLFSSKISENETVDDAKTTVSTIINTAKKLTFKSLADIVAFLFKFDKCELPPTLFCYEPFHLKITALGIKEYGDISIDYHCKPVESIILSDLTKVQDPVFDVGVKKRNEFPIEVILKTQLPSTDSQPTTEVSS